MSHREGKTQQGAASARGCRSKSGNCEEMPLARPPLFGVAAALAQRVFASVPLLGAPPGVRPQPETAVSEALEARGPNGIMSWEALWKAGDVGQKYFVEPISATEVPREVAEPTAVLVQGLGRKDQLVQSTLCQSRSGLGLIAAGVLHAGECLPPPATNGYIWAKKWPFRAKIA